VNAQLELARKSKFQGKTVILPGDVAKKPKKSEQKKKR